MIMLANSNLLMMESAIPVNLKERWCYDNVDEAFVFSISEKCYCPFSLYLESKSYHKYPLSNVCAEYLLLTCDQVLEKYTEKKSISLGSYRFKRFHV